MMLELLKSDSGYTVVADRESYDQMRDLVKNRRATKEDIFLRGLQAYCNQ